MNINERLREHAQNNGIKQSYISSQTGISNDAISKIMNNKRKATADEFLRICAALKIDPNEFRGA